VLVTGAPLGRPTLPALLADGYTWQAAADDLGVSRRTIARWLAAA
jgi:transposase